MALIDSLPQNYQVSRETADFQKALNTEVNKARAAKDDLFLQLDVNTATWGLSLYEKTFGLDVDVLKSYDFRRSRIKSKMRSQGVTTKAMIQNAAISFSNGIVDIIEHTAEYRFDVKFTGTVGLPPNMDDLTATIEEIKPAHLAYTYIYIYIINSQLKPYTHAQLKDHTHFAIQNGEEI